MEARGQLHAPAALPPGNLLFQPKLKDLSKETSLLLVVILHENPQCNLSVYPRLLIES
jgi:hypothetical protein